MPSNPSPSLITLAFELHMLIFSDLAPKELLTLGQTCKELHEVMSDRAVWEAALRSVCREYSLFEPSFPFKSMDVPHLQRATFGPTLWQRRLAKAAAQEVPLVPSETEVRLKDQEERSYIRLMRIPGNRYFIASTKWNIELWDLGVPYAKGPKPNPTLVAEDDL
ncbi:hypothetical protein EST38_g9884 [Candolleomyces aberdarensis]|uniref:F-box domain-containing protein n=1 Tax=Candolleomyces aberdarensis TaxID=2316362 RepID=A0A4Q2D8T8_9AGAR|nr:hypothetical protein EST38_g9884 [Candolleomyces aberdarensis]